MMRALIVKDFRLSLPALAAGAALFLMPCAVWTAVALSAGDLIHALSWRETSIALARLGIVGATAAMLSQAVYGGIAFARERRDRSGEFLNAMPVPRARIVASKLLVTAAGCALPWIAGLALYGLLMPEMESGVGVWESLFDPGGKALAVTAAGASLALMGLGWLASSLLRSETIASAIAIFLVITTLWIIYAIMDRAAAAGYSSLDPDGQRITYLLAAGWVSGGIGLAALAAGTFIALRRPV